MKGLRICVTPFLFAGSMKVQRPVASRQLSLPTPAHLIGPRDDFLIRRAGLLDSR